jgi:hypothetical protein
MYTNNTNKALKLNQVNAIVKAIETSDLKRFENSLTLAGLIAEGNKWLKDAEGQTWLKSTKMAMDEFIQKTYGFQKSFYYKLLKAANVPADVVKEFTTQTAKLKAEKLSAPLSIEALLKYYAEAKLENNEAGEGEGESESEPTEVKAKAKAVLTFTFKIDGFEPVSLRIDDNGEFKTSASAENIAVALDYLAQAVAGAGLSPKAPKEAKIKAKAKALPKPNTAKAPKPRKAEILSAQDFTFAEVTMDDVI